MTPMGRHPFCFRAAASLAAALTALAASLAAADGPALPMRGADISALTVLENAGAVYRLGGEPVGAIEALRAHGVNWFRLRLFVNPTGRGVVVNDLPYTLALAKRIKAAGGKLLLDFHYSDTWADPSKQFTPKAWEGLGLEGLEQRVFDHTREAIAALAEAGAAPDMVQIGNEIAAGMLWPTGRLWVDEADREGEFDRLARLLDAGIRAARQAPGLDAPPLVMIHIDRGDRWEASEYYFTRLERRGIEPDVIGFSYYPRYHGTLAGVRENLRNTAERFGKPVVLVETGYAYSGPEWEPEGLAWPITPQGQKRFLADVVDAVASVPDGLGWGVFWWYPEAVPVGELGFVWAEGRLGLFGPDGEVLPAAKVFLDASRPTLAAPTIPEETP